MSVLLDLAAAARTPTADVLAALESSPQGLTHDEVRRRLAAYGPNATVPAASQTVPL